MDDFWFSLYQLNDAGGPLLALTSDCGSVPSQSENFPPLLAVWTVSTEVHDKLGKVGNSAILKDDTVLEKLLCDMIRCLPTLSRSIQKLDDRLLPTLRCIAALSGILSRLPRVLNMRNSRMQPDRVESRGHATSATRTESESTPTLVDEDLEIEGFFRALKAELERKTESQATGGVKGNDSLAQALIFTRTILQEVTKYPCCTQDTVEELSYCTSSVLYFPPLSDLSSSSSGWEGPIRAIGEQALQKAQVNRASQIH